VINLANVPISSARRTAAVAATTSWQTCRSTTAVADDTDKYTQNALGSRRALQLDQLGARQRNTQPVRSEVDKDGDLVLDADDATQTVLVVCDQIPRSESLSFDRAVYHGDVEWASWQVAPCGPGA